MDETCISSSVGHSWRPCQLKRRRDACLRLYTRRHRTRCPLRSRQLIATRLCPAKTSGRRATPSIQAVTFSPHGERRPSRACRKRLAALDAGFLFAGRHRRSRLASSLPKACRTGTDWSRRATKVRRIAAYAVERTSGGPSVLSSSSGVDRRTETPSPCTEHRRHNAKTSAGAYDKTSLSSTSISAAQLARGVDDVEGFPPCLVLERGRYRLSDRMAGRPMADIEQRALLHTVRRSHPPNCATCMAVRRWKCRNAFMQKALFTVRRIRPISCGLRWTLPGSSSVRLSTASPVGTCTALPTGSRYAPPEAMRSSAEATHTRKDWKRPSICNPSASSLSKSSPVRRRRRFGARPRRRGV